MASLIYYKNSPFYWVRVYNPLAADIKERRKSLNTKIRITEADLKRIAEAEKEKLACPDKRVKIKLRGNKDTAELLLNISAGLRDRKIQKELGISFRKKKTLSEGWEEFKTAKCRPGDPNALKGKTLTSYEGAKDKFIEACGDKRIEDYTNHKDFADFLKYLSENPNKQKRKYSDHSIAIYCRSLRTLWNFFIKRNLTPTNIIERISPEDTLPPKAIPIKEMEEILKYLREKDINEYYIIRYLLLTGCRPSSALVQKRSMIFFDHKYMLIRNVKARKKKKNYSFPLYRSLEELVIEIIAAHPDKKQDDVLFNYIVYNKNYRDGIRFWDEDIEFLLGKKKIKEKYMLKQIRKTFISYAVNVLEMPLYLAQRLADHEDEKTTENNYLDLDIMRLKNTLDGSQL